MNHNILFSKAVILAAEKHQAQTMWDGSPYILHPIRVAETVREWGFDLRYQIAALLHDIPEDTAGEELLVFGTDIREAVKLLTGTAGMDEAAYLERIPENHMAATVKAADLLYHMWECSVSNDASWASGQIEKARKYYLGKLNKAVDDSIRAAESAVANPLAPKKDFSFAKKDFKLYCEIRRERYLKVLAKYNPDLKPVRSGDEIYYRDEMGGYLVIENNRCFLLNPYGWDEVKENPIYGAVDPLEEYPASNKSQFEAFIAQEKENRTYFFDFVEIEKL